MCAAPEISCHIHPRPLPVLTPPPQASSPTRLTLLASSNICWQPGPSPGHRPLSLFPLHGHFTRVRGFLCPLGGSVCPSGPLPTSPPLPSPAQKPTSSVVRSCSAGVWMLFRSPLCWGWSSPHLLFSMAISPVTLRGAIRASASLVPGDLCGWRGGQGECSRPTSGIWGEWIREGSKSHCSSSSVPSLPPNPGFFQPPSPSMNISTGQSSS